MSIEIASLAKKIDRILYILEDDDRTKGQGLVSEVRDHGNRIESLERSGIKDGNKSFSCTGLIF